MEKRAAKLSEANKQVIKSNTFSSPSTVARSSSSNVTNAGGSSFYSTPHSKVTNNSNHNSSNSSVKKSQQANNFNPKPQGIPSNRPVASFQLVSRKKFCVEAPYDNEMIQIFQKFPSKTYDAASRKWAFPLSEHQKLLESMNPLLARFQVQPLPKFVLDIFRYSYTAQLCNWL